MEYCTFCGAKISGDAGFCPECGRKIVRETTILDQDMQQEYDSHSGLKYNTYGQQEQNYGEDAGQEYSPYPPQEYGGEQGQQDYPYNPEYDRGPSQQVRTVDDQHGMKTAIKVFMVIGTLFSITTIVGLIWCIPMTVSVFHSLRDNRRIGIAMKICTLLFVNLIAGILLLCLKDPQPQEQYY